MISLRIVIKCIVMFVLVNTFRMSNRPFVATLSIHSSPAILFLSSSNGSATPLVLRPVLTLKSFNVTPIDTGQKNDRRFDADRLNQQAQMLRPKYTDQPLSSYDQVMSLQTPNNLNPLMNRWMRNGSTGQRFQMLLRSFPRPTISNPFRSFRYPADSSSITDSFTKPTTYETLDHTNANLHSLLARPAVEPEFGTLSHLLHRFPSSLESIPMELAEQPTLASFGDTKSSPGLEIHSESDFVDHSHGSIDTFFDPIIPTEFDRLNTHLRHHHRSPSPSSDSVDIFSAKSLYPFVTYDLDEFGVPMLKSTRHPPRSTRKSKRRRGNLDRLMVKGRARPESSSIQIDGPVAFEEPEDLQVNDAKDSDERLTTNSNSESKKVKPIRPNKGNNSSNLDNEALLKLLDQKLSSAELLSLLVNKLNSNPKEQSIVLQTLTTPQHSFQQSASYESENFFLQRAKPNEDRVASIANGERSMNEFEQFNYEKDYSYFEMPKCASALNSTYCLQDEHYPKYV